MEWVHLPQGKHRWQALVNTLVYLRVLDWLSDCQFLKKGSAP